MARGTSSPLNANQHLVRLLINDAPLEQVLTNIIVELESLTERTRGVAYYVDDEAESLGYAAYPSFPRELFQAVTVKVPIAADAGTAGSAAATRALTITSNVEEDPNWSKYAHIAKELEVSACWVKPLIDRHGELVGALGMYAEDAREPTSQELSQLHAAGNFAVLAYEVLQSDVRTNAAAQRVAASEHLARQYAAVRDELVSTLNHVIRTPLTSVVGFALTLTRADASWDEETARQMAIRLAENARKLQDILTHELDRIGLALAEVGHLDLTSMDINYLRPDLGLSATSSEVALACRQAGLHLLNVLRYCGIEPAGIKTHAEALDLVWPNEWVYDAWCAWHACRVALKLHGWDAGIIAEDRRGTWRTAGRVAQLQQATDPPPATSVPASTEASTEEPFDADGPIRRGA